MKRQLLKAGILSGLILVAISLVAYWLVPKPELVTFTTYWSGLYMGNKDNIGPTLPLTYEI